MSWCFSTLGCGELGLAEVVRLADRFACPHPPSLSEALAAPATVGWRR